LDYATSFGAILANGTGVAAGAPITLTEGLNDVNVTTVGTFTIALNRGTSGNVTSDVCTVTGSPVAIVSGNNNITTTAPIGNIEVRVALITTQTKITDTVTGTALDLTDLATTFGMSRLMFSGLVWLAVTIIICGATFRVGESQGVRGGGKVVLLVFDVCIIAGAVLGLMSVLVAVLMFIAFGAFTSYVIFFRGAHV